jgi:hypothetical protein
VTIVHEALSNFQTEKGSQLNPQAPVFLAREYDRCNESTRWKFKTGEDAAIMKNLTEKVKDGWLQEAEEKRDQNLVKVAEKIQKFEATTKDPVKATAKIEKLQYKEAEKHKKNLRGKNLNSALDVLKIGRELDPAEGTITYAVSNLEVLKILTLARHQHTQRVQGHRSGV